ncbi:transposase [Planctomycetota bacterium]
MKYHPDLHHRRSIRLGDFDYSTQGAYFVTICANDAHTAFGRIEEGIMSVNEIGQMVEQWYKKIGDKFPDIQCDEYIVMPDHFHFIIFNTGENAEGEHMGSPLQKVIQWFKAMTTNEYIRNIEKYNWPRFNGRLWQRNYYEHIVRNEYELNRIREYIKNNPAGGDISDIIK